MQVIEITSYKGCEDSKEEFVLNGGVRGGGAERSGGEGSKGGAGAGVAVRAGGSSLNTTGLFLGGN
jgi:hypothetical protein